MHNMKFIVLRSIKIPGFWIFALISFIHIVSEILTVAIIGSRLSLLATQEFNVSEIYIIGAVFAVNSIISLFFQVTLTHFSSKFGNSISIEYLQSCFYLSKKEYEANGQPYLIKNSVAEAVRISEWIITPLAQGFVKIFIVIGIAITMTYENYLNTLILFSILASVYLLIYILASPINRHLGEMLTKSLDERSIKGNDLLSFRFMFNGILKLNKLNEMELLLKQEAKVRAVGSLIAFLPKNLLETLAIISLIILSAFSGDDDTRITVLLFFGFAGYRLLPAFQAVYYGISRSYFNMNILETIRTEIQSGIQNTRYVDLQSGCDLRIEKFKVDREEDSLSFPELNFTGGQVIHLSGKSGVGKSTLFEALIGYENRVIENDNWSSIDTRKSFLLAQNIPELNLSLEELLTKNEWCQFQFLENIQYKANSKLNAMSGGQQQRILIAYAMTQNFKYIFIDEGFSGFDESLERLVLNELKRYATDAGAIVMVTTHRKTNIDMYDSEVEL